MSLKNISGLKREDFQAEVQGKQTDLFILRNNKGCEVAITNYGGALVAIMVPDRDGKMANVIQGHDNIQEVISSPEPFLSTLIGRYGNRICKGKFTLEGKEYSLTINNGPNSLHGGPTGCHAAYGTQSKRTNGHCACITSSRRRRRFSGKLDMNVVYSFTDDNELVIEYKGTTDKTTIVNMTNHGFFSLPVLLTLLYY